MPTKDEDVVDGTLNLWSGFAVPARQPEGKSGAEGCKLFLDHGLKVICSGNEAHFDYLMKREAWIAKRRRRSETAVALRTEEEGTGKGIWARTIGRLYGRHAMQLLRPEHVVGKFNPHLESLLMVIADEAMFVGDPRHRNVLHGLITEPVIPIERKFVDVYNAENYLNIYTLSNSPHTIDPGVKGGRRYFVPTVSSEHASDHDYFRKIMVQLEDEGGYEALLYHLLHEVDLRDFNVRDVPKTAGLAEQAAYSRKGVDLLVEKACSEAIVPCGYELRGFQQHDRRQQQQPQRPRLLHRSPSRPRAVQARGLEGQAAAGSGVGMHHQRSKDDQQRAGLRRLLAAPEGVTSQVRSQARQAGLAEPGDRRMAGMPDPSSSSLLSPQGGGSVYSVEPRTAPARGACGCRRLARLARLGRFRGVKPERCGGFYSSLSNQDNQANRAISLLPRAFLKWRGFGRTADRANRHRLGMGKRG